MLWVADYFLKHGFDDGDTALLGDAFHYQEEVAYYLSAELKGRGLPYWVRCFAGVAWMQLSWMENGKLHTWDAIYGTRREAVSGSIISMERVKGRQAPPSGLDQALIAVQKYLDKRYP